MPCRSIQTLKRQMPQSNKMSNVIPLRFNHIHIFKIFLFDDFFIGTFHATLHTFSYYFCKYMYKYIYIASGGFSCFRCSCSPFCLTCTQPSIVNTGLYRESFVFYLKFTKVIFFFKHETRAVSKTSS